MSGHEVERGIQRRRFLRAVGRASDDESEDDARDLIDPATVARAVSARVGRAVFPREGGDAVTESLLEEGIDAARGEVAYDGGQTDAAAEPGDSPESPAGDDSADADAPGESDVRPDADD